MHEAAQVEAVVEEGVAGHHQDGVVVAQAGTDGQLHAAHGAQAGGAATEKPEGEEEKAEDKAEEEPPTGENTRLFSQ